MPVRRDEAFADLPGIVLFHAPRSNCSARVRLLLAEKSLDWENRVISLQSRENRTAEYFAINPKGLVPSLIHHGSVVTESNDILNYLEGEFPRPAFLPDNPAGRARMARWMKISAEIHLPGVKTLNYANNASGRAAPPLEMERYRALQSDPELVAFHAKAGGDGFSGAERARAHGLLVEALTDMDAALAEQAWLAGDDYSLADICWAPTIPTLVRSNFDLTPFAHVRAWHIRIAGRAAYVKAVTDWEGAVS